MIPWNGNTRMGQTGSCAGAMTAQQACERAAASKPNADPDPDRCQIEELRARIQQLEAQSKAHQQVRQALQDLEHRYHALIENIPDVVYSLNKEGIILTINNATAAFGFPPEELIGQPFIDLIYPEDRQRVADAYFEDVLARQTCSKAMRFRVHTKDGEIRWLEANCSIRFSPEGRFVMQEGVCRDITESILRQHTLIRAHEELEEQVRMRTIALLRANSELQKEIRERTAMEKALRDRETELEMEKTNLKETNTALKVLLKRREADKRTLEEQVLYNINKLVMPYLTKVQKEIVDEGQRTYLSIIESNMRDITNGFSRRLSLAFYGLSTSEFKVANFIRQGKKSREIADLLGLSTRTVEAFRQSVRKKLHLQNKKVNLRTFLMSIN